MSKRSGNRASPSSSATALPHSGNIADFVLPNGVRLLVYENRATPSVVVQGYLRVGGIDEPPEQRGLADFTAACLLRGTASFTYAELFERVESVGAAVRIAGGVTLTSFAARGLREDIPLMLDVLAEALRQPTFPEEEVAREHAEWIAELKERENDARAVCDLTFAALCYPEQHPFHHPVEGYLHTAQRITREDVQRFHAHYYAPQGMVIAAVGDVRAETMLRWVEARFADWRAERPPQPSVPPAPPLAEQRRQHVALPGKVQTELALGFPGPSQRDEDWLTCVLMNNILGVFGMYGRLGARVRKLRGLVYQIGSRFVGGEGPAPWVLSASTAPEMVEGVVQLALEEIRRLQMRRVSARELADNKMALIGSLPMYLETNAGIADAILGMVRYERGLDWLCVMPERIRSITAAEIQAAACKWLSAERFALATCGP